MKIGLAIGMLPYALGCSGAGNSTAASGNSTAAVGPVVLIAGTTPSSSTSPYTLALSFSATTPALFPSYGRFYINSSPTQNALAAGVPWYEFQIVGSPCIVAGQPPCGFSGTRIYIQVICTGFVGNAAGCESAVQNIDVANPPTGVTIQISSQNLASAGSIAANQGTISIVRSPFTPPPRYLNGLIDYGSKFEIRLSNVSFQVSAGQTATISTLFEEFWGDLFITGT